MPKRAALLFDQLMVALQKVVDNQGKGSVGGPSYAGGLETVPVMEKDQTVANSVSTLKSIQEKDERQDSCVWSHVALNQTRQKMYYAFAVKCAALPNVAYL